MEFWESDFVNASLEDGQHANFMSITTQLLWIVLPKMNLKVTQRVDRGDQKYVGCRQDTEE